MADIEVIEKNATYWRIKAKGIEKLAIATGIPNRVFSGSDMSRLKSLPGFIWHEGSPLQEWTIDGLAEQDGQIIFWGDPVNLIPIDSPLSLRELRGAVEMLDILNKKSDTAAFSIDSFFRLQDGGLFCFPINLMEFIHSRQAKELLLSREAFNHPDLKREERLSHTLAVLVFQAATGKLPFSQTGGYEWIHEEMRHKRIPSLKQNGMEDGALIQAVEGALSMEDYPSLEKWRELLSGPLPLDGTMTESFKASMEKNEDAFVKRFKIRKNSIRISLVAAAAALFLWIGVSGVRSYMAPPYTAGMAPREVVETFYQSISDLNTDGIDGTTTREAGKGISNQVATIFVLSKNKEAYSSGRTISPEFWREKDFVTLPVGYNVYGISDLTIEERGDNRFRTSYLFWYPPTEDMDNPTAYVDPHEIHRVTEEVRVIRDKRDRSWIIGGFTEISREIIPSRDVLPQPE